MCLQLKGLPGTAAVAEAFARASVGNAKAPFWTGRAPTAEGCGAATGAPNTAAGPPDARPANGLGRLATVAASRVAMPGVPHAAALLPPNPGIKLTAPKAGAELPAPTASPELDCGAAVVVTAFPKAGAELPAAPKAPVNAAVAGTAVERCAPSAEAKEAASGAGVEAVAAEGGVAKPRLVKADVAKGPDAGISGVVAAAPMEPNGAVGTEPNAGAAPAGAGQLNAGVPDAPPSLEVLPLPRAGVMPTLCPAARPPSLAPVAAVAGFASATDPMPAGTPSPTAKVNAGLPLLEPKGCAAAANG